MAPHIFRNALALLLVLTLCNLAASFAALHAVRSQRADALIRVARVDFALATLTKTVEALCAKQKGACDSAANEAAQLTTPAGKLQ
jgi:hypothetical protein